MMTQDQDLEFVYAEIKHHLDGILADETLDIIIKMLKDYKLLSEENAKLFYDRAEDSRKILSYSNKVKSLNSQVKTLNDRISHLESERKDFVESIKSLNRKIHDVNHDQLKQSSCEFCRDEC